MSEAVILSAVRTPIGVAFKGSLVNTPAEPLAELVVTEALERSGLTADDVDDIVLAESMYGGGDLARHAAVAAGMPRVPGQAVNRHCAQEVGLSREEVDAWAARSHQRAVDAIDAGTFDDEIVPVQVTGLDGQPFTFSTDEGPRRGSSVEKLATLKPLHPEIDGFSVTAGNASGINDAAAALVLADADVAAAQGVTPLATVRAWASVGVEPGRTGMGAIEVIPVVLDRAGLTVADVDLWEINEAFASVPLAACRVLDIDEDKVNIFGSGCSLGHPVAASGARMITTLTHELRRRGGGIGVAAMCAGGGQGGAVVIEVPAS